MRFTRAEISQRQRDKKADEGLILYRKYMTQSQAHLFDSVLRGEAKIVKLTKKGE